MKKTSVKVLVAIACIILLWALFFSTDYILAKNDLRPVFAVRTAIYKDGGSKEYMGLGYKVIKFNTLEGRTDAVIGPWSMNINDIKEKTNFFTDIKYEYFRVHSYREDGFPIIKTIVSVDELNKEFTDFSDDFLIDSGRVETILNKYDADFFENKSLIYIMIEESSGSITHILRGISVSGDTMTINIDKNVPEQVTDDMAWWLFLIEGDKSLIDSVKNREIAK